MQEQIWPIAFYRLEAKPHSVSLDRGPKQSRRVVCVARNRRSNPILKTMSAPLADVAITGFAAASSYDLYRPSYPAKAVQQLLARLNIAGGQGARILDLAAGTGKFTQLLAEREERFEIVAVEPHEGMRSELEKKGWRNVTVIEGDARRVPLEDGSVDAVIVAQVG